jgi:hypothetical protein
MIFILARVKAVDMPYVLDLRIERVVDQPHGCSSQ